jgi:septal ring factor EnvC (AmiA/AmiB activator)
MKNGTARAIGLAAMLLLPAAGWAMQAGSPPAPSSSTLQHQLRRAQVELQHQRAQTDQLRTRVNKLEQSSAVNRARLEERDRKIAELQRKLATLSASHETTPAPSSSR